MIHKKIMMHYCNDVRLGKLRSKDQLAPRKASTQHVHRKWRNSFARETKANKLDKKRE